MPDRTRKKRPADANRRAWEIVQEATEDQDTVFPSTEGEVGGGQESQKNPHAVALGRLGGKRGGPARAKSLSPERRREIARKAAKARWEKTSDDGDEAGERD